MNRILQERSSHLEEFKRLSSSIRFPNGSLRFLHIFKRTNRGGNDTELQRRFKEDSFVSISSEHCLCKTSFTLTDSFLSLNSQSHDSKVKVHFCVSHSSLRSLLETKPTLSEHCNPTFPGFLAPGNDRQKRKERPALKEKRREKEKVEE